MRWLVMRKPEMTKKTSTPTNPPTKRSATSGRAERFLQPRLEALGCLNEIRRFEVQCFAGRVFSNSAADDCIKWLHSVSQSVRTYPTAVSVMFSVRSLGW